MRLLKLLSIVGLSLLLGCGGANASDSYQAPFGVSGAGAVLCRSSTTQTLTNNTTPLTVLTCPLAASLFGNASSGVHAVKVTIVGQFTNTTGGAQNTGQVIFNYGANTMMTYQPVISLTSGVPLLFHIQYFITLLNQGTSDFVVCGRGVMSINSTTLQSTFSGDNAACGTRVGSTDSTVAQNFTVQINNNATLANLSVSSYAVWLEYY